MTRQSCSPSFPVPLLSSRRGSGLLDARATAQFIFISKLIPADVREYWHCHRQRASPERESLGAMAGEALFPPVSSEAEARSRRSERKPKALGLDWQLGCQRSSARRVLSRRR